MHAKELRRFWSMTYEFEYLLHLAGVAALGLPLMEPRETLSWERLFAKAADQTVFALAAVATKPLWANLSPELRDNVKRSMYSVIVAEERRQAVIVELLNRFAASGIPCAVLKGCSLAALYQTPTLRESGDVDFYVGKAYEDTAISLLKHEGVGIRKRNPMQHESAGEHPEIGSIEVHAYLFREEDRKLWFDRSEWEEMLLPFQMQSIGNDESVPVLAVQDNAEFLCLHLVKHFIRERCCIRSILDVGLFLNTHSDEVNFEHLWQRLKECQYDGILQVVLTVCVHYMGMSAARFPGYVPVDEETLDAFLDDMERRWTDGNDCRESLRMYEAYLFSKHRKHAGYWRIKRAFWERLYALVPSKEKLQSRFSHAERHVWLLPAAWLLYLIGGASKTVVRQLRSNSPNPAQMPSGATARIDLFKKLRMMK